MNEARDFKGVWIPKEVWLNKELTLLEKVIFIEIDSLDNENHCIAGNEYFAEFCNCSESKVSKAVKKLKDLGMIEEILPFDGRHRKLRVVKNAMQSSKKCYADSQKVRANNITSKKENKESNSKELLQNFEFGGVKQVKSNLYSKCIALINAKTADAKTQKLLTDWFNMLLEKYKARGKVLYQNVFKGKLNTLDEYDVKDWNDIIKYNTQRGYEAFYPIKQYSRESQTDKSYEKNVTSRKRTRQEEIEHENWVEEMKAKGVKVVF